MRIYVAGRTTDVENVRRVQQLCLDAGHEITHDWTRGEGVTPERLAAAGKGRVFAEIPDEQKRRFADQDLVGAGSAQLIIAVASPGWWGTMIEIGIGLVCGRAIWLVGPVERNSVFFYLDNFRRFDRIEKLADALAT